MPRSHGYGPHGTHAAPTSRSLQARANDKLDGFPPLPPDNACTHACFLTTMEPKHIVYTNQMERLPHPFSSGNNYLVVAYNYDSNCILMQPIKSQMANHLTKAIADIYHTLAQGGCKPLFHHQDNECSQELNDFSASRQVQYQLAPPHEHRSNAAERAI